MQTTYTTGFCHDDVTDDTFDASKYQLKDKDRRKYQNNPLLVHPEVGKTKRTVYNLPTESHTYGVPLQRDPETAGQGTSC